MQSQRQATCRINLGQQLGHGVAERASFISGHLHEVSAIFICLEEGRLSVLRRAFAADHGEGAREREGVAALGSVGQDVVSELLPNKRGYNMKSTAPHTLSARDFWAEGCAYASRSTTFNIVPTRNQHTATYLVRRYYQPQLSSSY